MSYFHVVKHVSCTTFSVSIMFDICYFCLCDLQWLCIKVKKRKENLVLECMESKYSKAFIFILSICSGNNDSFIAWTVIVFT